MHRFEADGGNFAMRIIPLPKGGEAVEQNLDGGAMIGHVRRASPLLRAPRLPTDDLRLSAADAVNLAPRQHGFVFGLEQLVLQRGRAEVGDQNFH